MQSGSLAIFGHTGDRVVDEGTTPSGIGPREMVTVCLAWRGVRSTRPSAAVEPVGCCCGSGSGSAAAGDPATAQAGRSWCGWVSAARSGRVRQWVSWVGLGDVLDVMVRSLDDPAMTGTYHVTSPNPVTNAEMMAAYRRLLGRRVGLASPAIVARFGAPLLGTTASLALAGRRAVPTRLLDAGFTFQQPDFEPAAKAALEQAGLL